MTEMHSDVYGVRSGTRCGQAQPRRLGYTLAALVLAVGIGAVAGVFLGLVVAIVCGLAAAAVFVVTLIKRRRSPVEAATSKDPQTKTPWSKDSP